MSQRRSFRRKMERPPLQAWRRPWQASEEGAEIRRFRVTIDVDRDRALLSYANERSPFWMVGQATAEGVFCRRDDCLMVIVAGSEPDVRRAWERALAELRAYATSIGSRARLALNVEPVGVEEVVDEVVAVLEEAARQPPHGRMVELTFGTEYHDECPICRAMARVQAKETSTPAG